MCDETPRLRVADLAQLAQKRRSELAAEGRELHPVVGAGRKLAAHFWGSAWMKHLALCEAGGLCLAPGRSLLRHGCVLDLCVAPGLIDALVSAQELFEVRVRVETLSDERLENLRAACAGHIDSLVTLLEGRVDATVLQHLCDPETGLLPDPCDWHMGCTCPDWVEPCPHAAAAIYAAGCLIDADPSLLFLLRGIEPASLLTLPVTSPATTFDAAALSSTFGIDIDLDAL